MSKNFINSFGMDIELIYSDFLQEFEKLNNELDLFVEKVKNNNDLIDEKDVLENITKIEILKKFIMSTCRDFFYENKEYILYNLIGKTILSYSIEIRRVIARVEEEINEENMKKVFNSMQELLQAFFTISNIVENEKKAKNLISDLENQVKKATESVKSVISAKEALENKPTEQIYSKAAKKYINTARFYAVLLLGTLGIFYYITSNFFENFQMISIFKAIKKSSSEAQTLAIFFFITKLTIVSIVITLATIFIRRSSHFRKLHDQANQTSLELNALPNYLRQVDSEHHSEIYKEMIPKFFGKELDQSQNDKVGDLVKDQLAAGTELIKASAELVKAKGSTTPPP